MGFGGGSVAPQKSRPGSAPGELAVYLVDSLQGLRDIEPDWRALWSSLPDAMPFQSPDWLIPWWTHYGEGALLFFIFRCGAELVGIAPLCTYCDRGRENETVRKLFLLGTGNTDYLDVMVRPEFRTALLRALSRELSERAEQWDRCEFHRLREGSPLLDGLAVQDCISFLEPEESSLCLDLREPRAAHGMFKTARYYARYLGTRRHFTIETATFGNFEELFAGLERVHENRWHSKGLPGVLSEERDRSFCHQAARRLLQSGWLRFYVLRVEKTIAAAFYGFRHNTRTYLYLCGFDPEYGRFSVATVLMAHAVHEAMREGCGICDFLRGHETYKYRWGVREEPAYLLRVDKLHGPKPGSNAPLPIENKAAFSSR